MIPSNTWDSPLNILVILAHPDDPEFLCGATLAKWARARHHITYLLHLSLAPAGVSSQVASAAVEMARAVMTRLEVVGVLCVEFFVTEQEELLFNELAPRPHKSGHLTIDAHVACQFEQQVRAGSAVCRWLRSSNCGPPRW